MAKLTIRVNVLDDGTPNGRTVSKFRTTRLDNIVFHNDGAAELAVTVKGATPDDSPLCDAGDPVPTFSVKAGDSRKFSICGNKEKWGEFKYTAQIGTSTMEDPIVIIEKWKFFDSSALAAATGAVVGLAVGVVLTRMFTARATKPEMIAK